MKNDRELFDAGRNGVKMLLAAAPAQARSAHAQPQERMIGTAGRRVESRGHRSARARWSRRSPAFWKRSGSSRWTRCSSLPTTWRAIGKGEKLNTALVNQARQPHQRNPAAARRR